jgi:hypothetical protein
MGIHSFAVLREKKHKQRPSTRNEGHACSREKVDLYVSY